MTILNILCAKKTKVHGMRSRRWSVKDKLNQYKGIINLHERDKNIFKKDVEYEEKRLHNDNRSLEKEVHRKRVELVNACLGDKQRLRNTLSEHKNLQLAFQNSSTTKVIDHIEQENFYKKKKLDKINFTLKKKTEKLIYLKLQHAELEDRIEFEAKEKIPVEVKVQKVFGMIQDAILKQEAARAVREVYKKILAILKKDAMYYDAVLAALQIDGYNQAKCIYTVTEMGQLATEYSDDRKIEYSIIEREIKNNMQIRETSIKEVTENLHDINHDIKFLIRHDSVIELNPTQRDIDNSKSATRFLNGEISHIEEILDTLRCQTLVDKIEDIYPRILEQKSQAERLKSLVISNTKNRDILLKKVKHGEEMFNNYNHSMVRNTFKYKRNKLRANDKIERTIKYRNTIQDLIQRRTKSILDIRISLQQILELLRVVHPLEDPKFTARTRKKKETVVLDSDVIKPEFLETDVIKIIDGIFEKLNTLNAMYENYEPQPTPLLTDYYEKFIFHMTGKGQITEIKTKEEVLGDMDLTLVKDVPTRDELKKSAIALVEYNKKMEELMGIH